MSRRARSALALGPILAAMISGGAWQARAQAPSPQVVPQQTPTTAPNLLEQLLQTLLPTTTTTTVPAAPESPAAPSAPAADSGQTQPGPPPQGDGAHVADGTIPPEALARINSVNRSGSNNNLALLEALRPLTLLGMTMEEAAILGMGQFPVAGEAYWSDDWWMPRFTPTFHLHMGTDIFAARGTPVRSPVDGRVEFASEGAGGLAAYVTAGDGTYYYMAHLDGFAPDVRSGSHVKQGTVVGFVGDTGNAVGGSPHVHFEIHPGGGAAINPKSTVDRWVEEAIANVPKLLPARLTPVGLPRPITAAGLLRRLDVGSLGGPTPADGPRLWASSVRRDKGGVRLLTSVAGGASGLPDWDPRMRGAEADALDRLRAQQLARELLAPLTPKVLVGATQHAHHEGGGGG